MGSKISITKYSRRKGRNPRFLCTYKRCDLQKTFFEMCKTRLIGYRQLANFRSEKSKPIFPSRTVRSSVLNLGHLAPGRADSITKFLRAEPTSAEYFPGRSNSQKQFWRILVPKLVLNTLNWLLNP